MKNQINSSHTLTSTRCFTALLVAVTLLRPVTGLANDGFGELPVGGIYLSKTNDISMRNEKLDISYSGIQVAYEFENESDSDVTSVISFPLPLYGAFPSQSGVIAKGQPSGFSVLVNNEPIQYSTKVQAIKDGKDVTGQLRKLGFTERDIANMPFAIDKNISQRRDAYKGVVSDSQLKSLSKLGLTLDDDPGWSIQVTYQWVQKFPAKSKLYVSHKYKPFVAEGTASGYGNDRFVSRFCIDPKVKEKLDGLAANEKNLDVYSQLKGTIVAYVLKTANTWKDGIGDFTLRIHKGSPEEIISLCFPGQFKKIDASTLEVHFQNFNPQSDLDIYFANVKKWKPEGNYGSEPLLK